MDYFYENEVDEDFYFDPEAEDEESISLGAWIEGYNSEPYCDWPENKQWEYDNPDYGYEQAKLDEAIYDMEIIEPWRDYRDEKSDSDEWETFPSYSEWQEQQNFDQED